MAKTTPNAAEGTASCLEDRIPILLEHAEETLLERGDRELLCGRPGQVRPPAPSCSLGSARTGAKRTTLSEAC